MSAYEPTGTTGDCDFMRLVRIALVGLLAFAASTTVATASAKDTNAAEAQDAVILVMAPTLTWDDIDPDTTPALWKLAEDGAVADLNARTRQLRWDRDVIPGPEEFALTISSGAWASPAPAAGPAYSASESAVVTGTAGNRRERTAGGVGAPGVVWPGIGEAGRVNEANRTGAVLGALGAAAAQQGIKVIAIGNSDVVDAVGVYELHRPAGLATSDLRGRTQAGDVSAAMLSGGGSSSAMPRSDTAAMLAEYARGLLAAAPRQRSLVIIDSGDLYRAWRTGQGRAEALASLDELVAGLRRSEPSAILVAGPSLETSGTGAGFSALISWRSSPFSTNGLLTSPSTRRDGVVAAVDIAPTLLGYLDAKIPASMSGSQIVSNAESPPLPERIARLERLGAAATSIDAIKAPIGLALVLLMLAGIATGVWVLLDRASTAKAAHVLRVVARVCSLTVLAILPASWLANVWLRYPQSPLSAAAAFTLTVAALVIGSVMLVSRARVDLAVMLPTALGAAVLLADQWLGHPVSFAAAAGYSPLGMSRFYGMDNQAAAVLVGCALVAGAVALERRAYPRGVGLALAVWAAGAVVVLSAALPAPLGSNIGVAVWGTVTFVYLGWVMCGLRPGWTLGAVSAVSVVALVGGLAWLDSLRGATSTHLGRAVASATSGAGTLMPMIERKVAMNIEALTYNAFAYVFAAILVAFAYLRWRPRGAFKAMLDRRPVFAEAMSAGLLGGGVAFFTEDSGLVVPLAIAVVLGFAALVFMLEAGSEDAGGAR